ncbi:MAG: hypothetical protein RTU09_03815 [Candidatus Thorarchaeota archaeon]
MVITILLVASLFFSAFLLAYGKSLQNGHTRGTAADGKPIRSMWLATLLDCDYEPTKHAFGPGRTLPFRSDTLVEKAKSRD